MTVDIGTGYYMEKTIPEAVQFFERKIEYLKQNIERLQPIVMDKHKDKTAVEEALDGKTRAMQAAAQASAPRQ